MRREHAELGGKTQNAVRFKNFKLLQNRPFEPLQLFDLLTDSCEVSPLGKDGIYTRLYRAMIEHYHKSGAVPWQKPLPSNVQKYK